MLYIILGLAAGAALQYFLPVGLPAGSEAYVISLVLVIFGHIPLWLKERMGWPMFWRFLTETALALLITFWGERMDLPLYLAVWTALTWKVFHNYEALWHASIKKPKKQV